MEKTNKDTIFVKDILTIVIMKTNQIELVEKLLADHNINYIPSHRVIDVHMDEENHYLFLVSGGVLTLPILQLAKAG